jgi:hypothetical protein
MAENGWSIATAPRLDGRTVVVTGANSGLGFEASRLFALKGADVVLACRSPERGATAREAIEAEFPASRLEVRELDLASLDSVASFAESLRTDHDRLDVLCNNAGVMAIPRSETADGFETQLGVNHLGHFALTGRLLPMLRSTPGESRVVTQSSGLHERGEIDFADLPSEHDYDRWDAYAQSKLANLLFAYELQRRLTATGVSDVLSVGCHPGWAATNLQYRGPEAEGSRAKLLAMRLANAALAQSAERGALPMVYAATAAHVAGGDYVGPGGPLQMRGDPSIQRSSEASYDREDARRLWERSEELTGVRYDLNDAEPIETQPA